MGRTRWSTCWPRRCWSRGTRRSWPRRPSASTGSRPSPPQGGRSGGPWPRADVVVVCDHVYEEYAIAADFPQTAALVANGRVVVLRTFSKIYGLAGLRIGYGVGSPDLIGGLNRGPL